MKRLKFFPILTISHTGCSFWSTYSCIIAVNKTLNYDIIFIDGFQYLERLQYSFNNLQYHNING